VPEEPIEGAIEAVVVDQGRRQGEEVFERRAAVPRLRDVQFTRRLAQPREPEHSRHRGPRHLFAACRQQAGQERVELERAPERPAQPHIAKRPAPFQPDAREPNRNDCISLVGDKEIGVLPIAHNRPR